MPRAQRAFWLLRLQRARWAGARCDWRIGAGSRPKLQQGLAGVGSGGASQGGRSPLDLDHQTGQSGRASDVRVSMHSHFGAALVCLHEPVGGLTLKMARKPAFHRGYTRGRYRFNFLCSFVFFGFFFFWFGSRLTEQNQGPKLQGPLPGPKGLGGRVAEHCSGLPGVRVCRDRDWGCCAMLHLKNKNRLNLG